MERGDHPHAEAARPRRLGDRLEQANALIDLATVRRLAGDYPGAERERAGRWLYRALGNRLGRGQRAHRAGQGAVAAGLRRADMERALDLYRELGDRPGEAGALVEVGVAGGMTSDFRGRRRSEPGPRCYRRLGDRPGEAYALRLLGIARGRVGDFAGRATC